MSQHVSYQVHSTLRPDFHIDSWRDGNEVKRDDYQVSDRSAKPLDILMGTSGQFLDVFVMQKKQVISCCVHGNHNTYSISGRDMSFA